MIEPHPLQPFLPHDALLLMLGSFPPQQKRWSMEFYYPNWTNDMWRIVGQVFFGDKHHFELPGCKAFNKELLIAFLTRQGIALYDTATAVRRLRDNASDKYLEVVTPTDIPSLLARLPHCQAIVTTGEKATQTLCQQAATSQQTATSSQAATSQQTAGAVPPPVGGSTQLNLGGRIITLYRMPSSSRAYPLSLEKKAEAYQKMFSEVFPQ